jgi:hypothetical protein
MPRIYEMILLKLRLNKYYVDGVLWHRIGIDGGVF